MRVAPNPQLETAAGVEYFERHPACGLDTLAAKTDSEAPHRPRETIGIDGPPSRVETVSTASRVNRGRAAAAENRAAILVAARDIFAEHGRSASMTLIAQTAGVGQGSLYRHFPTRGQLIHAVYESNLVALESLAQQDESTIDDLLEALYRQLTDAAAFIAVLDSTESHNPHLASIRARLRKLLSDKFSDIRGRGSLRDEITANDIYLAFGMLAALLHQTPPSDRRGAARHAWGLLRHALYRTDHPTPVIAADGSGDRT